VLFRAGRWGSWIYSWLSLSCEIEGPRPEHLRPTGQEIVWRLLVQVVQRVQLVTGAEAVVLHARCIDAVRQCENSQI
jgi:hypothetical protein